MIKYLKVVVCLCSMVLFTLLCGPTVQVTGGTTTETTNGISATVRLSSGSPASGARVSLRPENYLAGITQIDTQTVRDAVCDSNGLCTILNLKPGSYRLSILTGDSSQGISLGAIVLSAPEDKRPDTLHLAPTVLEKSGVIQAKIPSSTIGAKLITLRLNGTDFVKMIPVGGNLSTFRGVPYGNYTTTVIDDAYSVVSSNPCILSPGDTVEFDGKTFVSTRSFTGLKRYFLNTGTGGASILSDVTLFPIHIELNGSDPLDSIILADPTAPATIRFLDDYGTVLPLQIEKWDTISIPRKASMWIRVNILHGNVATNSMRLLYGGSVRYPQTEIFSTGFGYAATWHFSELQGDTAFDASGSGNLFSSLQPIISTPGVINTGIQFDGTPHVLISKEMNFFNNTRVFTFTGWVQAQSFPFEVIHFVDGAGVGSTMSRMSISIDITGHLFAGATPWQDSSLRRTAVSLSPVVLNSWHFLAVVFDYKADSLLLYIDGARVPALLQGSVRPDTSTSPSLLQCVIGSAANQQSYFSKGSIDEFRIFKDRLSNDWIKMVYESERSGSTFITTEN